MDNSQKPPKEPFTIKAFNLGGIEPPTREEIYNERVKQILGLENELDNSDDEFYFPTFNMGNSELSSRAEIYDEACDRHLVWIKSK